MRAQFIEDADEEDQPTWNIWEYDATTQGPAPHHRLGHTVEDEGHDIMPHYLPDGTDRVHLDAPAPVARDPAR